MYQSSQRELIQNLDNSSSGNFVITTLKLLFLLVVFVAGGISGKLLDSQINKDTSTPDVQGEATQKDQTPSERIAKMILLTTNEEPTIATIVDIEKLKTANPEFYAFAEEGDKLFIYSDRAIIYREKSDLIINMLPIKRALGTSPVPSITLQPTATQ